MFAPSAAAPLESDSLADEGLVLLSAERNACKYKKTSVRDLYIYTILLGMGYTQYYTSRLIWSRNGFCYPQAAQYSDQVIEITNNK